MSAIKNKFPFYKFPNKSLFHNSAKFTKERRVRGFDELLKILLELTPRTRSILPELKDFLEIEKHIDNEYVNSTMLTFKYDDNTTTFSRETLISAGAFTAVEKENNIAQTLVVENIDVDVDEQSCAIEPSSNTI